MKIKIKPTPITGMMLFIISSFAMAENPASQDWVRQYVRPVLPGGCYSIGDSAQGGTVVFVTPDCHHGLVVSNTDQSSTLTTYYDATSLVSNNSLYDPRGANYTDWMLPNNAQWDYICAALSNPKFNTALLQIGTSYWSSTLVDTATAKGNLRKIEIIIVTPPPNRYVCVTGVSFLDAANGLVRSVRTF